MPSTEPHRTRTLWLCGVLHGFTHIYHVALLPLYLLIEADLKLTSVGQATFLMTAMMLAYFVPSYPMGVLADRISRKKLMGVGLAINGLGFVVLSLAPSYPAAVAGVVLAGFGGSFYHPAATALIARLFPLNTGKALGLAGVGASVGFFIGPIYSGWRAATAGWRAPVLELGLLGIVAAGFFFWLGQEHAAPIAPRAPARSKEKMFPTPVLWLFFIAVSLAFSLRDFAGTSMGTLGSLFLQQARGFNPKETGLALSVIFLASVVSNPLFGGLSDRGRIRWTCLVLMIAAITVAVFPRVPRAGIVPVLAVYGFFFLANYPIVEAALMEAVPDAVRGRVFGLFITISGLGGNLSHWLMGRWVKGLGAGASVPGSYYSVYVFLSALILLSLIGLPCLHAIRRREEVGLASHLGPSSQPALRIPDPP
ncbi:MAG: MFS transporter [Limisphaerales bacterium]